MTMNNNEQAKVCRICGKIISARDAIKVDSGIYCDDCAAEHLAFCERCETWHDPDDTRTVRRYDLWGGAFSETWCLDCAMSYSFTCADCGERIEDGGGQWVRRVGSVCNTCVSENYFYCDECGEYVRPEDWDDDSETCTRCTPSPIVGYHRADATHPRFCAAGETLPAWESDFVGIGCEIEIDRRDSNERAEKDSAKALQELLGERAVFERDGSLRHGFEIVTRPHTIKAFLNDFPLEETLDICKRYGYSAHDIGTCGFHLHISRAYFGRSNAARERAIGKCLAFFDVFFEDIVKASRRTYDEARHWAQRVPVEDMRDAREKAKEGDYDIGRYAAVNTTNEYTVEFRIMRGTLNAATLRACIDFLLAIARNAKRCAWDIATTDAAEMLKGIKPATVEYLRHRGAFLRDLDGITTAHDGEEVK